MTTITTWAEKKETPFPTQKPLNSTYANRNCGHPPNSHALFPADDLVVAPCIIKTSQCLLRSSKVLGNDGHGLSPVSPAVIEQVLPDDKLNPRSDPSYAIKHLIISCNPKGPQSHTT